VLGRTVDLHTPSLLPRARRGLGRGRLCCLSATASSSPR
jgi:hypothetical protein